MKRKIAGEVSLSRNSNYKLIEDRLKEIKEKLSTFIDQHIVEEMTNGFLKYNSNKYKEKINRFKKGV